MAEYDRIVSSLNYIQAGIEDRSQGNIFISLTF